MPDPTQCVADHPSHCARCLRTAATHLSEARDRSALQQAMRDHIRVWQTLTRMAARDLSPELRQRIAEGAAYVDRHCPDARRVAPSDHHIEHLIALDTKIAARLEQEAPRRP